MGHVMGGVQWVLLSGTTRAFNSDGKVGNGLPDSDAGTRRAVLQVSTLGKSLYGSWSSKVH